MMNVMEKNKNTIPIMVEDPVKRKYKRILAVTFITTFILYILGPPMRPTLAPPFMFTPMYQPRYWPNISVNRYIGPTLMHILSIIDGNSVGCVCISQVSVGDLTL
jgi:hypothetical protein